MSLSTTSHNGDEGVYRHGQNPADSNDQTSLTTPAEGGRAADIWQRGTTPELIQLSLDALLGEQPVLATSAASAAMERVDPEQREIWSGWSAWLIGLSQLYTNNPEPALANLQRAQDIALQTQQSHLAMAAYLGIQLISAHQHQNELRRHETELRQQATSLQQQIAQREILLGQQFRAIIALAMEAVPGLIGQTATPSLTPKAQLQRVAIVEAQPQSTYLPPLEIRCFGEFQVFRGGEEINFKQNRKPADIFKYLLAHRERAVSTDTLLGRLWPDVITSKGMHRLHLNISTLRQILNPPNLDKKHGGYIITGANSYYLNPQISFDVDVDQFTERYRQAQALERSGNVEHSIAQLEAAVSLYRDDFLIENLYDDWTSSIRDYLRQAFVDMLGGLSKYYMLTRRYEEVLTAAKKMLDKDEYREDAYCFIMRALVNLNQRNQALLQYQQCVEILDHDLGVRPTQATTDLYFRIKNNELV